MTEQWAFRIRTGLRNHENRGFPSLMVCSIIESSESQNESYLTDANIPIYVYWHCFTKVLKTNNKIYAYINIYTCNVKLLKKKTHNTVFLHCNTKCKIYRNIVLHTFGIYELDFLNKHFSMKIFARQIFSARTTPVCHKVNLKQKYRDVYWEEPQSVHRPP